MDQSDDMVSSELESTLGQTSKKAKPSQRIPKCTRCQNHGKKVEVKFHKRECEYRYCLCEMCILTMKKQQIMKVQTAQRRARQQYEMLMEMKKKKAKSKDSETPPAPSISGSNDSNSSDMPSLSNHNSNSESCRGINEPVVNVPILQNRPPLMPHTTSPSTPLFEPESNTEQVEVLLGYSKKLLQRFGYPWESLSLMYVILKDSRVDVEVAMRRIIKANSEIQAMAQFKASRLGCSYYYPGYTGSLGFFPYSLGSNVVTARVPSSLDSPPEQPLSYPETINEAYGNGLDTISNQDTRYSLDGHRDSDTEEVEVLLGYSARLLQRFGYPWESLSLMYVILKDSRADVEVAMRRITKANSEIQATAQFKSTRFGSPFYYPGYSGSLGTLGNPTYFGQVPYVGMASPPTTAGMGLFPYSLGTHVVTAKVPSSPDSPPERPSSYPETSMSHRFKIEKTDDTD